jgi:hypothetical protein
LDMQKTRKDRKSHMLSGWQGGGWRVFIES